MTSKFHFMSTGRNIVMAMMLVSSVNVFAQKAMKAPTGGKQISDHLIGIFFEDICSSADGGLCAELVQNGSFEYNPSERDGWGPGTSWTVSRPGHSLGLLEVKQQEPLNANNPNYMRLHIERAKEFYDYRGWTGFGLQNAGFDGISVKKDAKYNFSAFLRDIEGDGKKVRVSLVQQQGWQEKLIADAQFTLDSKNWKKYETVLTATEDCQKAQLRVLVLKEGTVDVDMVSLIPQDTYKGHGLRKDLAETLEALHPKFMRFPGGCVVHGGGDGFWDTYRWKNTIGPKEQRKAIKNTWGYHQSFGLGYFEYFQFCEDLGMEPLPILPCGVSCQGTNGGWNMTGKRGQEWVPMSEMDEWVDEALDLIEWANGDATTEWGKKRAEAGHPAPFNLKYLGLGNEELISEEFAERFKYIYERVRKAHPEIIIVGTAGPGSHSDNPDYINGWKLAEEIGLPIIDEHYYEQRTYFQTARQYDNYPRDRKTKVYLGEYAAKDKKLQDALAEALYLLHVEKNGDVVCMTSYAPLFAKKNATNWNPDLIYFDNEKVYPTCSYYVQQMFGLSDGQYFYGDCVKLNEADAKNNMIGQSGVLNVKRHELYLKIANSTDKETEVKLNIGKFHVKGTAEVMTISGQPDDENNYDQMPVTPSKETIKIKNGMKMTVKPYSFTLLTVKL
ncbi:MAG: alpha-N-arabinofuranosidase [Prevotellaceae bacterium]|nr:alpha-N-arabinofuranosidase [Candidatus Colivivens equi]